MLRRPWGSPRSTIAPTATTSPDRRARTFSSSIRQVLDESTALAFANGGTSLGLRREDLPGGKEIAAILRYPL